MRSWQHSALFGDMTVLENVIMGYHFQIRTGFWEPILSTSAARKEEQEIKEKALEILDHMELTQHKDELANNLPHGYQRELGVSMAIAANPELLLLDEPCSGMNPSETGSMIAKLSKIRERGTTLILVEHVMQAVMGLCDRIVVLSFGKKIAEGSPQEISKNEEVIEVYLGVSEEV